MLFTLLSRELRTLLTVGNRFLPPQLNLEKSNIVNSENTALFLFSCFQYILTSIVLSVGPPFRQPMTLNGEQELPWYQETPQELLLIIVCTIVPYLCTIIIDLLIAVYMLFRPSKWVTNVLELTIMSDTYRGWILALALGMFALAWSAEITVFPRLARIIGHARTRLQPSYRKKRRQYKVLLEGMGL